MHSTWVHTPATQTVARTGSPAAAADERAAQEGGGGGQQQGERDHAARAIGAASGPLLLRQPPPAAMQRRLLRVPAAAGSVPAGAASAAAAVQQLVRNRAQTQHGPGDITNAVADIDPACRQSCSCGMRSVCVNDFAGRQDAYLCGAAVCAAVYRLTDLQPARPRE